MENIIDKLGCAYNKNYKMKDKEQEEIRRPDKLLELYLAAQKQLMNLMAMPELDHIKQEMLEAINQAINQVINQVITNLEQKETLGKHTSLTGKEKRVRNSPDYSHKPSADPPSLKERDPMKTTPGFKFQPNDEEIIQHLGYKHSNSCQAPSWSPIKDCPGFYVTHPGHLPDADSIKEKKALYYYVRTNKRPGNGNRTGPSGYWRASGNNKILSETRSEIGYKRTLKYCEYANKNHKSSKFINKTNWMMHEYGLATAASSQSQEESLEHWTICKVTWITGKNIEVTNDFSREGSMGPSENKHKNELTMHTQNEGDPKISKIVDSKQEEIAQNNYHFIGDEFERWTQEKRGELREQRMNKEIHQPEEISPSYAFGIHPTPNIVATTHEVETAAEPQRFTNPGRITGEFEPSSFPEQTFASSWHRLNNSKFTGTEDGIQSWNPSMPDPTSPKWTPDPSSYPNFTWGEDTIQLWDPSWPDQTSALLGDPIIFLDSTRSKDQIQSLFSLLPPANHFGVLHNNLEETNLLDNLK